MAIAGQLALTRWSTSAPHEDPDAPRDESRFRDLFERSPAALLVMDQSAVNRRANATAAALLTEASTELAGTSLFDLSGLRELESGLALAASVVEHTSQGVIVTDADHRTVAVNPAFTTISGYTASEVLGTVPTVFRIDAANAHLAKQVLRALHERGHWQGEVWSRRKERDAYPKWVSVNEIRDDEGTPIRYVCIGSDMTSQESATEEILSVGLVLH